MTIATAEMDGALTDMRFLTAIPVYNEEASILSVLREVRGFSQEVLVIDDGSTDATGDLLKTVADVNVIRHGKNRGYGAALISAFEFATTGRRWDALLTMDCDGQHDPSRALSLVQALAGADIVSGSRYLGHFASDGAAPKDRMNVNRIITEEINSLLNMQLTDSFCGFKAYRVSALERLRITEAGWGMPLQLWVQAAWLKLKVVEIPVPRIYLDPNRSFGTVLNDPDERLRYYRGVIRREMESPLPGPLRSGA